MSSTDARVVVVGAGAAGLSAAHHLVQNGFSNVIVLEATDRIGGRIHTVEFGDGIIELGANWIHGTGKDNSMYTLAKEKGLIMEPYVFLDRIEGDWCTEDGSIIPKPLIVKAWDIFCNIEDTLSTFVHKTDIQISQSEFMESSLETALNEFKPEDQDLVKAAFHCMINYLGFHEGDYLEKVSLNLNGLFENISGGNVKIPPGFCEILRTITAEIKDVPVEFKKVVKSIDYCNSSGKVNICCNSNAADEKYVADHVILTCSLGYMKAHLNDLFTPTLSVEKKESVNRMGFGKVNKIFLFFDKPFWSKGDGGIKLAWKQKLDSFDSDQWYRSIFAFDEVLNNPDVLVAWIHGDAAAYIETLSDSFVLETCKDILQKFTKKNNICPTGIKRSFWCSNPFTLGSYSYYAVHSQSADIKNIAEPLYNDGKPVVCFAGEATEERYFSTTHGARSSGIREAERVIDYYIK
ncbi:spermine oxidase-like isoform X2 [Mytilus galloprovincialis]|uniref:spermine oxidase-like isoform X2 n=1 Tax=Mytilus galloprovincialis TaxID=29158 RepID=UPI003F7B8105